MDSPPKLSGETLIVHHIPLMHCQVSGGRKGGCAGSLLGDSPFIPPENLGLSRTTSLPERDLLHGEALLYSSLFHTTRGTWAQHKAERKSTRGDSMASDSSSFTSSNSEEQITAHTLPRVKSRQRATLRHNPFLCRADVDEDEGDGLSGYHEDCSFDLHGDTTDFHSFSSEPFHLHSSGGPPLSPLCAHFEHLELEPQRPLSSESNVSMDCGEQDWADDEGDEDHMMSGRDLEHSCCRHVCESSDSSCNSSDGVLVNFSAIYSKLNNAVPEQPQWCGDSNQNRLPDDRGDSGAFYLDLHCSPTEPTRPQAFPLLREPLLSTSSSCSAEHQAFDLDANCNSCAPSGHSELAPCVQGHAPCLQSQARLVVATQNYYKLVTCDLSQSSPSPAPSSTNSSDEQSRGSPTPNQPSHYYLFRQQPLGLEEEQEQEQEEEKEQAQKKSLEQDQDQDQDQDQAVEGQLFVNMLPARTGQGRPRSRSYDRSLDVCQCPQLGALERMLSCPVRLSEGGAPAQTPPPRVTSFAEIARSKRRTGAALHSPSAKTPASASSHCSADFCPIQEHNQGPFTLSLDQEGPRASTRLKGLMQGSHSSSGSESGAEREEDAPGGSVRPSPLGSYSPVQILGPRPSFTSSSSVSLDREPQQSPVQLKQLSGPSTPPPSTLACKRGAVLPALSTLQGQADTVSPLGPGDAGLRGTPARSHDCDSDYLCLAEKPPEEFCLSPDTSTRSSSRPHVSVDLQHKKGLVKAVNTAVDLIVAHFGTTRDPDVKSKLGNSWVSPNVGHLILKYLCPALHDLLQDGLKAYVRDLIIGQRRCGPWNLVEASTQPGPSTRLLHSLFCKISQYSELTSASMRFNAFIMGLLNLKSLELWFSLLHTHEDILGAHYQPWGFLPLAQGPCRALFEELLLLLQPLALLPFDLDGRDHLRRKELLCGNTHSLHQSERSTFQLMRGRSSSPCGRGQVRGEAEPAGESHKAKEGWWYQLMQSSQVYIDPSTHGSTFTKADRRSRRSSERQAPPTREGVVEGAESGPTRCNSEGGSVVSKGRLSWMGSPPEAALNPDRDSASVENQGLRWGHLFGATGSSSHESRESRRRGHKSSLVRALCHHQATEAGHLSFHRGDVLSVLRQSDPDTLLCSRGTSQGLVPIVYVTLGGSGRTACSGATRRARAGHEEEKRAAPGQVCMYAKLRPLLRL
ncbi:hypothetical protein WMY93_012942 [Mugilogobius chulae]|uniref:RUN and SH3 domain containing 2 n=1 Tax=Mugilogobius chulae TaxID=88201 RepID=A0AAW0P516_9GOBI